MMSNARGRCQLSSGRWESPGSTVRFAGGSNDDDPFQVATALDQIPQLMHELKSNGHASGAFPSGRHDQSTTRRKSHPPARAHQSNGTVGKAAAGSPTRYDSPYYAHGAAPLSPPPRALELVKEEVHRALQAFSTRPLKGETHPPSPRTLLRPYDATRDGRITYPEFRAGLRGLGIGLTAGEAEALARDVDSGDTGLVDRERFEAAAAEGWGREAAAVVAESFSATEHRNGSETVYDRGGAAPRDTPPRDRKRVPCRGGGQQVEPHHTDDCYTRAGEYRGGGQHGCSRSVTDGGGKVWNIVSRGGSEHACGGDEGGRARIAYGRGDGMEDNPYAGTQGQGQGLPPPPPSVAQNMMWGASSNSHATTMGKSRNTAAVSFERWHRRMTSAGRGDDDGEHSAKVKAPAGSSIDGRGKASGRARSARQRADSLNTLRSLLRGEGPDGEPTADGAGGDHCLWFESRDRGNRNGMHRQQHEKRSSRREEGGDDVGRCGGTSDGERRGVDKGYSPGGGRRRTSSASVRNVADDPSTSVQELEREHRHASRAESILRLRSKGDLVGLRRAISRADPSASGVISQREMERVILRRFGAGFSDDEARGLAARYGKEISGRAMVDYQHLFDSLEAKEAGLYGETTAVRRELPNTTEREKRVCSSATPRRLMPAAAGARSSSRRAGCTGIAHEGDGEGSVRDARPEESQLARRARAKTLALLDQHGTRSADQVFGQIDSARAQSLTAEQLREGLRVLSGSDPLSDIEYKALFRDIGGKQGRVKHKELLDTLRNAEGVENRERTQRKIAHQAQLPVSGRGSAVHWRHSDILDWYPPGGDKHSSSRTPGGKQHKETRRRALVFEKIRDRVRRVQDDRDSAGPVLDMFHRRGGGGGGGGQRGGGSGSAPMARSDDGKFNPPPLSPSALRAGLRSLGVPLGDDDFDAVLASTDPGRHGEVSYPDFCEVLRLHRLRGNLDTRPDTAASGLKRPSSAPPLLSSQAIGQGLAASDAVVPRRERGGGGGGARRRAMELAPAGDRDLLDGGVFHRNPATDGCANPNFTTTMVRAWDDGDGRGMGGRDGHRSGRRQSPAPAPVLTAACTVVRPVNRGQTVIGDNRFQSWNETGAGAERRFRQDLGAKARRHRSHSLSCHRGERVACEGWDNMGTPSPRTASDGIGSSRHTDTAAVISGGSSSVSRRGRGLAPRDSDLGFGSARMRSASRVDDRCSTTSAGGRRRRRRRRDEIDESAGLTRRRSMSLGVDDRYGEWARSSVGDLLRHDTWLGARCHTAGEGTTDRGRVGFAETAQGGRCGGDHYFTGHESSRYHGEGGKRRVAPYATDADEVQHQGLRTGGGHGGERGSGGGSVYRDNRNEQRQTMSAVTDRRVALVGGAERRGDSTHGFVRGRERVSAGGARREGGGGHREGRGRTTNATKSGDVAVRRSGELRGELRGELGGFSGEFNSGSGGGQFSPTRRWDDAGLSTGHNRARGRAVSTHSRGGSRPLTK